MLVERLTAISDAARERLKAVGEAPDSDAETAMFGELLFYGVIQTLEGIFSPARVHFFPVSATGLGKLEHLPLTDEEKEAKKKAGYRAQSSPPNQMFPELVFVAPVSIALHDGDDS